MIIMTYQVMAEVRVDVNTGWSLTPKSRLELKWSRN